MSSLLDKLRRLWPFSLCAGEENLPKQGAEGTLLPVGMRSDAEVSESASASNNNHVQSNGTEEIAAAARPSATTTMHTSHTLGSGAATPNGGGLGAVHESVQQDDDQDDHMRVQEEGKSADDNNIGGGDGGVSGAGAGGGGGGSLVVQQGGMTSGAGPLGGGGNTPANNSQGAGGSGQNDNIDRQIVGHLGDPRTFADMLRASVRAPPVPLGVRPDIARLGMTAPRPVGGNLAGGLGIGGGNYNMGTGSQQTMPPMGGALGGPPLTQLPLVNNQVPLNYNGQARSRYQ
ncbi:unnamed protein product [Vitrella brassicaformis CCMP3155]|uniref:Uncharacterized protein n=1 Tax=Vitrella brassicaformis (strain CCMP3155) TaxID=1169540 RepID=A0A0G4EGF1_VITBC|nr:unnamed protein product [Vitrella brassicaformis CCMP3155]|eukprot:CEL94887.1 unnamed protein product [Vitrella brassicaformis CCMP3155]